jgi:hypothetical protein
MQLTILSVKLPNQSDAEFDHEFRAVHVQATREIAESLGLISRYVQSVRLPGSLTSDPPLPGPSYPLKAFAQLTWASPNVLQGALHTSGYQNSAGKHIFAKTTDVFVTERLESDVLQTTSVGTNKDARILLTAFLLPKKGLSNDEFIKKWDSHASMFRSIPEIYQRNKVMDLTREQIEGILGNTLFPPEMAWMSGGYEEFVFKSEDAARSFLEGGRKALRESYEGFVDANRSMFVEWDRIVQYSEEERGAAQIIKGGIIGSALGMKTALGL